MSYTPPYTISDKILNLVVQITTHLAKVGDSVASNVLLRKQNQIKTIVGTLAIEGNNLDVSQVTQLLEGKLVVGNLKEIQEVHSALKAYENIAQFHPCKPSHLLQAHRLMMDSLLDNAGQLRTVKVAVKGGESVHIAPPPTQVPSLVEQLFAWLEMSDLNPLIASCVFHYEFEFIHPFVDGNGRMGRFWQTLILSQYDPCLLSFPVESIIKQKQDEYYKTLSLCDKAGNSTFFVEFMLGCILEAIESSVVVESPLRSSEATQKDILDFLCSNPTATIKILATKLRLSTRAIEKQLANLKKANQLARKGSARQGEWVILENSKIN